MNISGGGTGERRPGRKWDGGVREVGVEGVKRDFQGGAKGEKWENLRNVAQYFAIEKKRKEAGANKNRAGTGIRDAGRGKFRPPFFPTNKQLPTYRLGIITII